jgi:hypothetical protein
MGVLKMKPKFYLLLFSIILLFQSCDFNDTADTYSQKLVVFGSITAGLPVLDTVIVSRTAEIGEDVITDDLWINDAIVELINDSTKERLTFYYSIRNHV